MRVFSWEYVAALLPRLVAKIPITVGITLSAFALGLAFAVVLAAVRAYRVPVANQVAVVFVSFFRGTPILIQILICNLFLPGLIWQITGVNVGRLWPPLIFVVIACALNSSAFMSEVLRSALSSVDRGQSEAALSVGMTELQVLRTVVFPQAFRVALPGIANVMTGLLKDTSYAYGATGVLDVMGMVATTSAVNLRELEGYVCAAVIFFVLCLTLEFCFNRLSARLAKAGG
jgi:L-cystine transport system permease protein